MRERRLSFSTVFPDYSLDEVVQFLLRGQLGDSHRVTLFLSNRFSCGIKPENDRQDCRRTETGETANSSVYATCGVALMAAEFFNPSSTHAQTQSSKSHLAEGNSGGIWIPRCEGIQWRLERICLLEILEIFEGNYVLISCKEFLLARCGISLKIWILQIIG